jgi:hypothetical protein
MPDQSVITDAKWVEWILKAAGALIIFLLGLGLKDVRDKLNKIDNFASQIEAMKVKIEYLEKRFASND